VLAGEQLRDSIRFFMRVIDQSSGSGCNAPMSWINNHRERVENLVAATSFWLMFVLLTILTGAGCRN